MSLTPEKNEYHIPVKSDGVTAIDLLVDASKLSRQKVKLAMQKGCVWLESENYTQRLRRAKKELKANSILHCYYDEKILDAIPPVAQLISDEGSYSIWNKPYGMLSQGSKWADHCTINRWAEKHLQPERPAFIVHRLDRAASGLIIIAHKKKIAAQFATMFREHKIEKHYQVWVEGDFSTMVSDDSPIKIITEKLDDKDAESHIKLLKVINSDSDNKKQSLLNIEIKTGRKHQIRKHLANITYPVIGDRLYNTKESATKNKTDHQDLQLKAISLRFNCPVTGKAQEYLLRTLD